MINGKFFVIAGSRAWSDDNPCNAQFLAVEISRANRVLYVAPPLYPGALAAGRSPGRGQALQHVSSSIDVLETGAIILPHVSPQKVSERDFDEANMPGYLSGCRMVGRVVSHLCGGGFYLLCENHPLRSFYLTRTINPPMTVYYTHPELTVRCDETVSPFLEARMEAAADVVVTSDDCTADQARRHNIDTYNIGVGFDLDDYLSADDRPADAAFPHRPVICFSPGSRGEAIPEPLLCSVADAFGHCTLLMAECLPGDAPSLSMRGNVVFAGYGDAREMIALIAGCDVCLAPYYGQASRMQLQFVARCLALGKAVVAFAGPSMFTFLSYVMMAGDEAHFVRLTGLALAQGRDERRITRRRDFANSLTWRRCVERLYIAMSYSDNIPGAEENYQVT